MLTWEETSEKQLDFVVDYDALDMVSKPKSYREAEASANSIVTLFPCTATFPFYQVVKKFVTDHKSSLFVESDLTMRCTALGRKRGKLWFAALSHPLAPAVAHKPELSRINKQEMKIMHFYKYLNTIPEVRGYKYEQYWL